MRRVRLLELADVPAACDLAASAGWNQTPDDWERMIKLEPSGCFGIEEEGRLVATTTLLTYGTDLAWVGMVLTHHDYQRRGYAKQLVTAALELAAARGIPCVKLDATDHGRPLYLQVGFEDEQPIERWSRMPAPILADGPSSSAPIPMDLDRAAFGVDRRAFLQSLPPALVLDDGYACCRPGARASYAGPCVARSPKTASELMAAIVASDPEAVWYWDILPANHQAVAIAQELGFQVARRLVRMVKGVSLRGDESMIYAIAGFEAG
jgi:GNAT superfamily N-acetyltransferase